MTINATTSDDEAQIRRLIDSWARALHAKDLDAIMAHYAPDALAFDLAPPLQHRRDAIRSGLKEWLPTWQGPIGYEIRDLVVTAAAEIAFAHSLNRLTGTRTTGETTDVWVRSTVCFRKVAREWRVVHEHTSVPFYMDGSFRAAVDLRP